MNKYLHTKDMILHFVEYSFTSVIWLFINSSIIADGFDMFFLPQELYRHTFIETIPFLVTWLLDRMLLWINCYMFIERFLDKNVKYILVRGVDSFRLLLILQKRFLAELTLMIISRYLISCIITQLFIEKALFYTAYYIVIMLIETAIALLMYSCANDKRSFAAFVVLVAGLMTLTRELLHKASLLPADIIDNNWCLLICFFLLAVIYSVLSAVLRRKDY